MKNIYYNIHIPKNAGGTFDMILERIFKDKYLIYLDIAPGYIYSDTEKRNILIEREVKCISGHAMRYPGPNIPCLKYYYMTFLRDPIERIISLYRFEREISSKDHSSYLPIEEWINIRMEEDQAIMNPQTYHLLGSINRDNMSLRRSKELLDSFFFVGIVEMFDESLIILKNKMNLGVSDLRYIRKNVTISKKKIVIDPKTKMRLMELNQIDIELYNYAKLQFEETIKKLDRKVEKDLKDLKTMNQIYSIFNPIMTIKNMVKRTFFLFFNKTTSTVTTE